MIELIQPVVLKMWAPARRASAVKKRDWTKKINVNGLYQQQEAAPGVKITVVGNGVVKKNAHLAGASS